MSRSIPVFLFISSMMALSCGKQTEIASVDPVVWSARYYPQNKIDSLPQHQSYLSVYSQIYSETEHKQHSLTATVSMRNVNLQDSVFVERADYYNTEGDLIRTYFTEPIFIKPMETVEIVINQRDPAGGTGGNFLFTWRCGASVSDPLFEAVMISTYGQQGLSYSTQAIKLK